MSATASVRPLTQPSAAAEAVRDAIRERAARGESVRVVGRGTWLDAGRPVAPHAQPLAMERLTGIVEYNPGDLTLTALAGTTLAEIASATRAERQWLALEPFGRADGTIGATVATASYGPLAQAFGTPRDNVLGVEFVTGDGQVARGGGRVVKNVAGYDLARLVTGAWGTLGVVTEVAVRLRALPEVDATVALAVPGRNLEALLARLRAAAVAPLALELVAPPLAARIGVPIDVPVVLARLGGNEQHVRGQWGALADVGGDALAVPSSVWEALREFEHAGPRPRAVARLSARPSQMAATWARAMEIATRLGGGDAALVHATVGRGVVRVAARADDAGLRAAFGPPGGEARVFERLPAPLWPELSPSAAGDRLSQGVRAAFDPHHILNPGILGE